MPDNTNHPIQTSNKEPEPSVINGQRDAALHTIIDLKLAEALLLRAETQTRVAKLRERVAANALVDEGSRPIEDPVPLLKQALTITDELQSLILRINATNARAKLADGRSIMEAISEREALTSKVQILSAAVAAAQATADRYSPREIKRIAKLDVPKLNKQIEDLAKKTRKLNAKIQETNWNAELTEV